MWPKIGITTISLSALLGCRPKASLNEDGDSTSESDSESGQDESDSTDTETGDDGTDPPWPGEDGPVACDCDEGQLCVVEDWGCEPDDGQKPVPRCVDTPAECVRGDWACEVDDPCVRALCGPWATCGSWSCDDVEGDDMVCYSPRYCEPFEGRCPSNQKCVPWSWSDDTWDTSACVDNEGSDPPGTPCTVNDPFVPDTCDAASVCWTANISDTPTPGVCRAFCDGTKDAPTCPAGQHCLLADDDRLAICLDACDPLLQSCGEGEVCNWIGTGFACVEEIYGPNAVGEPCAWVNDCSAGDLCVAADSLEGCMGARCCTPHCDTEAPDECGGAHVCVPLFEEGEAPPDMATVGVCALPGSQPSPVDYVGTGLWSG